MGAKRYNLWLVIRRAEDVPGAWLAHCLDWDICTQGNSLPHVLQMAVEAISIIGLDDIAKGNDHERAPEEFWKELDVLLSEGKPISFAELLTNAEEPDFMLATQVGCVIRSDRFPLDIEQQRPRPIPVAWTNRAA